MSGRARRAQKTKQRERLKRSQKARRADARHCADLFDEARFEWEQGQHEVARRLLDRILRLRPSHHAANEWLADLAFRDGAYVDCLTHFDRLQQPPAWPPVTYYAAIAAGNLDAPDRAVALLTAFLAGTKGTAAFEVQRDHARHLVRLWSKAARTVARATRAAHTARPASAAPVPPKATTRSTQRQASAGLLAFDARGPEPTKASAPPPIPPARPATSSPGAPAFPDITLPPPPVDFELVRDGFPDVIAMDDLAPESDVQLRQAYVELRLQKGFDELISLGAVHDVTHFRYQLETVRRILRDFRGRVLLADEVGLGKTIEACLALKEYWLRGLVRKALILTPASLVSQWSGELTSRFDLTPATTDTAAFKSNPDELWASAPLVVASLPLVRQATYRHALAAIDYDLVIVDEAHGLKNRASAAWQLVNSLKTRFLLLLSATPVGNNLSELYNLILLLRPGLLKTEATFRRDYGQVATLEDRDRREGLRGLLREVMVRNTRAHIDLRLPRRLAATEVVTPDAAEAAVLGHLSAYVRDRYATASATERWRLTMLQMQAGSSPSALRYGLRDGDARGSRDNLAPVLTALDAVGTSAKTRALGALVRRAPGDKKIVFTRFRATLDEVAEALRADGHAVAVFHGGLTAAAKDDAIAAFEADAEILLSSEIGGEGRNLQFCRTVVNFDLPWNPTAIEQRVGRVHRLGQTREVFVFNLCLAGSIEEHILRILHDKINLFELVAGEMEMILGQIDPDQDFASLVMDVWAACGTPDEEARAFGELSTRLVRARSEYQKTREIDRALFSEDFEV